MRGIHDEPHADLTFGGTQRPEDGYQPRSTLGILVVGGMTVVMAFVFAAMGAPGVFSLFAILTGVVFVVASLVSKERQERLAEEERMRAEEERARFSEEVAQTVKESLKGTIKVRCRYCGALSDENDEKCESCGAPL